MAYRRDLICIDDYEKIAAKKIPKDQFEYYRSGAFDELTLRQNRTAYDRIRIIPRVLRDVEPVDLTCKVLGLNLSFPIGISPTAFQMMANSGGEVANALAAGKMGVPITIAFGTNYTIEAIAKAAPNTMKWSQILLLKDPAMNERLIRRAEAAGYKAMMFTIDLPRLGCRRSDFRNDFKFPKHLHWMSMNEIIDVKEVMENGEYETSVMESYLKPFVTWEDIKWLKSVTKIPVILKGILAPEDALLAIECGADAIIVSNHGGRHMNTLPTIEALPKVVAAVNGRIPVFFDGGIRQGTDVFKALALGASLVMIGRPALWGLAVDGQNGVEGVLRILKEELSIAMAFSGCKRLTDIKKSMVANEFEYSKF